MPCFLQPIVFGLVLIMGGCWTGVWTSGDCQAGEFPEALETLAAAEVSAKPQTELQQAWRVVTATGTVEQIPAVLAKMKDVGPLAENWLRSAVDTIAEREFSVPKNLQQEKNLPQGKTLPQEMLESFVLDYQQPPRGRVVAYQWLVKIDAKSPERLLPGMLDDPSLELRYDAVDRLLAEAKAAEDSKVQIEKYQRALQSARDMAQLRKTASRLKKLGETPNLVRVLGFLDSWHVVGPFDNADRAGFEKVFPPEQAIDLKGEYLGKSGTVKWTEARGEQDDLDKLGSVDLNKAVAEEKSVIAYGLATFVSKQAQDVEFRYESIQATKLWVNGKELAAQNLYHSGSGFDLYVVAGKLKAGPNQILVKVCQNEQTEPWTRPWEFRLRITDSEGKAIRSGW